MPVSPKDLELDPEEIEKYINGIDRNLIEQGKGKNIYRVTLSRIKSEVIKSEIEKTYLAAGWKRVDIKDEVKGTSDDPRSCTTISLFR